MTMIIGHRVFGGREVGPDAFSNAIEAGVDMVEFDLRMTGDKQIVLYHGKPGEEGKNILRNQTLKELEVSLGREILTLDYVLDRFSDQLKFDIEIKETDIVDLVTSKINKIDPGRVVITSFLDSVLIKSKKNLPEVKTGLILGSYKPGFLDRMSEIFPKKRFDHIDANFYVSHRLLSRGRPGFIWGVNEPVAIKKALRRVDITGIITDNPRLAQMLKRESFST